MYDYLPLSIWPGTPLCQPSGEFHGLDEVFSASVVAQPVKPSPANANTRIRNHERKELACGLGMGSINDLIAFEHVTEFPAWHHVGDAAIGFNSLNLEFR